MGVNCILLMNFECLPWRGIFWGELTLLSSNNIKRVYLGEVFSGENITPLNIDINYI